MGSGRRSPCSPDSDSLRPRRGGDRFRGAGEEEEAGRMEKTDREDSARGKNAKGKEREQARERDGGRHSHRSSAREMGELDVDAHGRGHSSGRGRSSRKSRREVRGSDDDDDGGGGERDGRDRRRSNNRKAEREADDDDDDDDDDDARRGGIRQRSNRNVERDASDEDEEERDGRHRDRRRRRRGRSRDDAREKGRAASSSSSDDDDERSGRKRHGNHHQHQRRSRRGERDPDDGNRERRRGEKAEQNGNGSREGSKPKEDEAPSAGKENLGGIDDDAAHTAGKPQGRSGGVYIPPFKLAQMMKDIQDKSSVEYQRITWDALRKSINGLVNKVNASNIKNIIPELLSENLIRGRGLFARSCMKSQMASPSFTHVFAALVAVVNTKFPELGELLLKRIILQFRRALKRNDKPLLLAAAKFVAHLVNQQVAHEVVALEVLMVLLETPTDDSVEVAVGFVKECGAILQDLAPQGLHGIFERFRGILHEGEIDKRVQFMIEGLFAIRKAQFQGHQAVLPELDLVEQEDQFTHEISLSDDLDPQTNLDIFRPDKDFLENEKQYEKIKRDILGDEEIDDGEESSGGSGDSDESEEDDEEETERMQIKDETETNLVNLRRTIYLTIMSSVDFEEAGHKLLKIKLEPGQEMELNIMLLECCSQERTYLRYYGLLGQRFCMINRIYQENFDECFVKQYSMIHRLETNKLRNVAKFFAHLLGTDALPWNVLGYIRLTEEDTTSSSRIFIKILFQELSEHLGLRKLNEKLNDPMMQDSFEGIFPKDNPKNTRFAINFFTSIGLGGITDSLREYLKNMPRLIMQQQRQVESESGSEESSEESDTSSSGGSESDSSDSESNSSDSESESESEPENKKRRKR